MKHPLLFYSTNLASEMVTFRRALLNGQAPDKGLYMPVEIPKIPGGEILSFRSMTYPEIAWAVMYRFLEGEVPGDRLMALARDAYDFSVPLEHVYGRTYVMRLDQGPTASFKDFAARMMGRLMQFYLRKEERKCIILTATSGDTGSAVANAFYGLDNIDVVVLFPEKEVTRRQRKQMTTLGKNIRVLALDAKFDDCQALVKTAFADPALGRLMLSSANSINIGRLVPQIVYYFYAWAKLSSGSIAEKAVFSVPSGNFGDMMGGVLAMHMGLPVNKFVIATNGNDEFPEYLRKGSYNKIEPSLNCISSAMNVGHPSNLARLVALYGGRMDEKGAIHKAADMEKMKGDLYPVSVDDDRTREAIAGAWKEHHLLLEPHGAVGWAGLQQFMNEELPGEKGSRLCISLETAHPAKFPEEIRMILGYDPALPPSLAGIDELPENYLELKNDYGTFRDYLLSEF